MGAETEIAWTDATFNPWWGCVRVSQGCVNCYAESFSKRTGNAVWGVDAPRRFFGEKHWAEPLKWNADAEKTKQRKRVFCASMADVFELRGDLDPWRAKLWRLIEVTPWLDWQLLTKRPENIALLLPSRWEAIGAMPPNVWLGVSAENQQMADERIPLLLSLPATVRFVSAEPLLGPIDFSRIRIPGAPGPPFVGHSLHECRGFAERLDWVICGGESGHGARPCALEWLESVVTQCRTAGAPCFMKQLGAAYEDPANGVAGVSAKVPTDLGIRVSRLKDRKGGDMSEWPEALRVREFPRGR